MCCAHKSTGVLLNAEYDMVGLCGSETLHSTSSQVLQLLACGHSWNSMALEERIPVPPEGNFF